MSLSSLCTYIFMFKALIIIIPNFYFIEIVRKLCDEEIISLSHGRN